mgnify:CR=1 FL=1
MDHLPCLFPASGKFLIAKAVQVFGKIFPVGGGSIPLIKFTAVLVERVSRERTGSQGQVVCPKKLSVIVCSIACISFFLKLCPAQVKHIVTVLAIKKDKEHFQYCGFDHTLGQS